MSLITRCPACATQFKVVPDQLKLSDGWVRCGHCSDVFDANRYLESRVPDATQSKPSGVHREPPPLSGEPFVQQSLGAVSSPSISTPTEIELAAPSSQAEQAETALALGPKIISTTHQADDLDLDLTLDDLGLPQRTDQIHPGEMDRPISAPRLEQAAPKQVDADTEGVSDFHIELQRFALGQGKPSEGEYGVVSVGPTAPPPASLAASTAADALPQTKAGVSQALDSQAGVSAPPEPGFVRQARRRAFWRSPAVRGVLTLAVLLLSALLAAQWALQERDRLAARYPHIQPLLASLCETWGCTIDAVRDLQAVLIDSATLTRRLGNVYSFDLVLKNTSAMPLAMPALELSLTDIADTVISRRVFLPEQLPGVPPLLPPQGIVSVNLRLSLAVGSELPMAGYRALVFYP